MANLEKIMEEIMTNMKRASSSQARFDPKEVEAELKKRTEEKERTVKVKLYKRLIRMMMENSVEAQRDFLNEHPEALMAEIDDFGNTIFHFIVQEPPNTATIKLLNDLVSKVSAETLGKLNVNGLTALHIAACAGNKESLQLFAKKNPSLLSIKDQGEGEWLPIHHAASWGREETVHYLLSESTEAQAENSVCALLLELLMDSNLHGLALELLKKYPHLATPDENSYWGSTMKILAEKSRLAFKSGGKLGFCKSLIYSNIPLSADDQGHVAWPLVEAIDLQNIVSTNNSNNIPILPQIDVTNDISVNDSDQDHVAWPPLDDDIEMQNVISTNNSKKIPILPQIVATIGALGQKLYTFQWNILIRLVPYIRRIRDQKQTHSQTLKLVRMMISEVDWTYNKAVECLKEPVLTAARLGIHEFVNEVLKAYPNSVLFYDDEGRNIFLLAVLHRKENVFSLIHDQLASIKDHTNYIQDISKHNILHLAGKMLAPPSEVPGAALQMQRELQWFTGIRDLFQPSLQEKQNEDGLTPTDLFTKEHENLIDKGERWMRDTAKSCSVVAALIITIVFAAAFTVPGGFSPNGVPIYLKKTHFRIFAVSDALALFASTISLQMFLGMLTSRYAEDDFLKALPKKLIIGLATLFLSSASMLVAFGAAFCILLSHPWKWAVILISLLGCLPVTLFAWMQYPLLGDIFISTYGPGILKPKKNVCMRMLKYCRQDPYL